MLGAQPLIIFIFGLVFLGEHLSVSQELSVFLTVVALLLLVNKAEKTDDKASVSLFDFSKYYLFPAIASGLAIVWDRYFLKGEMTVESFFVLDRIIIIPAFIVALLLIRRGGFEKSFLREKYVSTITNNWAFLSLIGLLFTVSVYTYNLALSVDKAALVGFFRNTAYPIAAFLGAFLFQQKIPVRRWVSLSLIGLAIALGAYY